MKFHLIPVPLAQKTGIPACSLCGVAYEDLEPPKGFSNFPDAYLGILRSTPSYESCSPEKTLLMEVHDS